jgi:hypothetical protein
MDHRPHRALAGGRLRDGPRPGLFFLVALFGRIRVAQRAQALAGAAGLDVERVAAQEVDVPVLERGQAGDVFVLDVVALGAELGDGGVQVAGVPQGIRGFDLELNGSRR